MKFAGSLLFAAVLVLPVLVHAADAGNAALAAAATAIAASDNAANAPAQPGADAVPDKPYSGIVLRNMFGLLPIPPPDTNPPAPPVDPPPKITPKGIMTIFGRNQAIFSVAVKPKAGQPAKDQSYVLSEGERQDDIEVQKINKEDGLITFINHGVRQELALVEANPGGPAGGPGAGPGGGGPGGGAGRGVMLPGGTRSNPMFPSSTAGSGLPGRQGNPGLAGMTGSAGSAGAASDLFNSTSPNTHYQPPDDPTLTTEQKVMLIEAQRAQYLQQNSPVANLLPPTKFTPRVNEEFGGPPAP